MPQPPTFAPNTAHKMRFVFRHYPNPQPIQSEEYGENRGQRGADTRCNSESLLPKKVGVGALGWGLSWL